MSAADDIGALWRRLRADPRQAAVWLDLARAYARTGQGWQANYTARQALRIDTALLAALDGLLPAGWREDGGDAALGSPGLAPSPAQTQALAARLHAAVGACPEDWLGWLYLARLLDIAPDAVAAPDALARAQALEPMAGESLHRVGTWRLNAGDHAGAVGALEPLARLAPPRHGSMLTLGDALLGVGDPAAARTAYGRAAGSVHPGMLVALADRMRGLGDAGAALALLHRALTLQYNAFALADCEVTLARIRTIDPRDPSLAQFAANLADRMGDARATFAQLAERCAESADPLAPYACGLPMAALYDDTLDAGQVADLHRRACAPLLAAGTRGRASFTNSRAPERRLRLGFVSADLDGKHPVSLFLRPLLACLDAGRFDVHLYDTAGHPPFSGRWRWIDARGADGGTLERAVLGAGIDILVDLGGHTMARRLDLFARRAAPVQVSFLGYPHSTGLSTIDWLIGDPVVSPAAHELQFSERIARLPGSVFCWAPAAGFPLPPPRPDDAPFVFGSFNNAIKLSPRTVELWAAVLRAVPDAQLLLKAPSLGDAAVRERFAGLFHARGIDPARLALRGLSPLYAMMAEYGAVDVALDPLPYNGGTTTLQALWMGVPVVTLAGDRFAGRMGASIMAALGRPEWVAGDAAGYVAAATALARERAAVRAGRAALRERLRASPLGDIDAYAGHFQDLLRAMWRDWCARDGA